ncbi:MAG: hypothetical protein AB8B74_08525 [Crocinitomicaceae bacterium]
MNWILTIFVGGFLCAVLENSYHGTGLFSVFELGLLISLVGSGAGLLPLILSLVLENNLKKKGFTPLKIILRIMACQLFFALCFIVAFYFLNAEDGFTLFTIVYFFTGIAFTSLNFTQLRNA